MGFSNIIRNLKEILYFKKLIKKYSNILELGVYKLYPSMRAIVVNNPKSVDIADKYFYKEVPTGKTVKLINKLNKLKFFNNKNKKTNSNYEAIYSANNYDAVREIKFFSFKQNKILTVCVSNTNFENQISQYEKLHGCFPMPTVSKSDYLDNAFEIEMIEKLASPNELEALKSILNCFSLYQNNNNVNSVLASKIISFNYENEKINSALNKFLININENVLNTVFPTLIQHGDLSRDNLIYGSINELSDFWWIDWEHEKERYFLYDFFFYSLNTAIYFLDNTALNLYVNGECDELLKEYFKVFGLEYNAEYRKDYFMIFVIEFIMERVVPFNNASSLDMYCDFINGIKF